MQLTIEQYNDLYGADIKEFKTIEFNEYITFLMTQIDLKANNEDIFTDIKKLV